MVNEEIKHTKNYAKSKGEKDWDKNWTLTLVAEI